MDPLTSPKELYRDSVSHALAGFQLLEGGLKTYIDLYYETVRQLLHGKLHFGFDKAEVLEAPLGRLLQIFSRVSSNTELLAELRGLVKDRNKIAHQSFVCLYGPDTSAQEYAAMTARNMELGTLLSKLLPRLHEETVSVFGVLEAHHKGGSASAG